MLGSLQFNAPRNRKNGLLGRPDDSSDLQGFHELHFKSNVTFSIFPVNSNSPFSW